MDRRILVVDDDLAILLTLKAVLELNGFKVETASSAHEAKSKLDTGSFEMVISDLRMESPTAGYEVIRAARRQAYNPATALLTAYPENSADWRLQGAQSLLIKPMHTGDLVRQIEALLVTHEDSKSEMALTELMKSRERKTVNPKKGLREAV